MKQYCYLGIDIGTSNTKAILMDKDGNIVEATHYSTPLLEEDGVTFFEIRKLELIVDKIIMDYSQRFVLIGVSFATVGETVIPVKSGSSMGNPLVWYDKATLKIAKRFWPALKDELDYSVVGSSFDYTFSYFKILWLKESAHINIDEVEFFLPLSSYFIYRYTRKAYYDFSQASRTLLFNQKTGSWNNEFLKAHQLAGKFPEILPMGTFVGCDTKGIPYSLGGHDHLVSARCLKEFTQGKTLVFDSIGTSESVLVLPCPNLCDSNDSNIVTGTSFAAKSYYYLKGIHFSGLLLEKLSILMGYKDSESCCNSLNSEILCNPSSLKKPFKIAVNEKGEIKLGKFSFETNQQTLLYSLYLYLSLLSKQLILDISDKQKGPESKIVLAGASTENKLYLDFRATILGKPLYIPTFKELGCTGAIFNAAQGNNDSEFIENFVTRQTFNVVFPCPQKYPFFLTDAKEIGQ